MLVSAHCRRPYHSYVPRDCVITVGHSKKYVLASYKEIETFFKREGFRGHFSSFKRCILSGMDFEEAELYLNFIHQDKKLSKRKVIGGKRLRGKRKKDFIEGQKIYESSAHSPYVKCTSYKKLLNLDTQKCKRRFRFIGSVSGLYRVRKRLEEKGFIHVEKKKCVRTSVGTKTFAYWMGRNALWIQKDSDHGTKYGFFKFADVITIGKMVF